MRKSAESNTKLGRVLPITRCATSSRVDTGSTAGRNPACSAAIRLSKSGGPIDATASKGLVSTAWLAQVVPAAVPWKSDSRSGEDGRKVYHQFHHIPDRGAECHSDAELTPALPHRTHRYSREPHGCDAERQCRERDGKQRGGACGAVGGRSSQILHGEGVVYRDAGLERTCGLRRDLRDYARDACQNVFHVSRCEASPRSVWRFRTRGGPFPRAAPGSSFRRCPSGRLPGRYLWAAYMAVPYITSLHKIG